jgi:hypothetical protein
MAKWQCGNGEMKCGESETENISLAKSEMAADIWQLSASALWRNWQ